MKKLLKRGTALLSAGLIMLAGANVHIGSEPYAIIANAENYTAGNDESGLSYYAYSDRIEITGLWDTVEELIIPSEITTADGITLPVTAIVDRAFRLNKTLNKVSIPGSVTSIGASAFYSCTNLESITLNEGIETIGASAFSSCSDLLNITIPGSVEAIYSNAFEYCTSMRSVEFAEGDGCAIGYRAFYNLDALKSVTMAPGVTEIGEGAFQGCDALVDVTFSPVLETIAENAFYGCTSLAEIDLPDSLLSLYPSSFLNTAHVTNQTDTVIYVDDWMISAVKGVNRVTIKEGTRGIAIAAFSQNNVYQTLSYVSLPEGLEIINESAFASCRSLVSLTLPSSLKQIDAKAFNTCNGIQSLTIPESVEIVGQQAFISMTKLTTLTFLGENTKINLAVDTIPTGTTIYGHNDSTAYQYADAFGRAFVSIDTITGDCNDDGIFNLADVVMLQRWILADGTTLTNWEAADLYEDSVIDVFDLVLMKRLLIKG